MNGKRIVNQATLQTIIAGVIREFESMPYIKIGVSNRHLHLSQADLEALFGAGYKLTPTKELQPGQFACEETVTVAGPKGKLERVRILGPVRKDTQFEMSLSDTFAIGVPCPVNESGNLRNAGTVKIINPLNCKEIESPSAIVALRHVHLCPETAERFDLKDKQIVSLSFDNGVRDTTFGRAFLRISPDFEDEIHLDTDEANAGCIKNGDFGLIIP
jgi:putative phosphotransacetylase